MLTFNVWHIKSTPVFFPSYLLRNYNKTKVTIFCYQATIKKFLCPVAIRNRNLLQLYLGLSESTDTGDSFNNR